MARLLEGPELLAYDVLPRSLASRVRVIRTPLLPPGTVGLALGRLVLLRLDDDRSGNDPVLAHELVHVRQWSECGVVVFLVNYLVGYFRGVVSGHGHRASYLAIDAEVAARHETERWCSRRRRTDSSMSVT